MGVLIPEFVPDDITVKQNNPSPEFLRPCVIVATRHLHLLLDYRGSLLELRRLLVVVYSKLGVKDLILISGQGSLQSLLSCIGGHPALLYESPEHGVVKVVDVTVRLSPAQVVPHVLDAGVQHGPAVKAGRVEEGLVGEQLGPVEHVAAGEQRHDVGHNLVPPPAVNPGIWSEMSCSRFLFNDKRLTPEDEGVFVTLAIAEHYLVELCHNIASAFVHQIQGCFLIGFGELVSI